MSALRVTNLYVQLGELVKNLSHGQCLEVDLEEYCTYTLIHCVCYPHCLHALWSLHRLSRVIPTTITNLPKQASLRRYTELKSMHPTKLNGGSTPRGVTVVANALSAWPLNAHNAAQFQSLRCRHRAAFHRPNAQQGLIQQPHSACQASEAVSTKSRPHH